MHTKFFDYIEAALKKTKYDSIQLLGRHLDISPNRISQWKKGRGTVTPAECVQVAELLGLNVEEIAFIIEAERQTLPEFREKWLEKAKLYRKSINPPNKYKKVVK
ncbi:helix-turn-helix transcriptional regulator [Salmonella enterica]|nr:helix-turn-helix transcriptional regulator [Salmonella enterica]